LYYTIKTNAKYSDINSSVKDGINVSLKVTLKTKTLFCYFIHKTTFKQLTFSTLFIQKSFFSISVKKNQFVYSEGAGYICAINFN